MYINLYFSSHRKDAKLPHVHLGNEQYWGRIQRRTRVNVRCGTFTVHIRDGNGGGSGMLYITLSYPEGVTPKTIGNFLRNHFPKNRVNRTLCAARSNVRIT